MAESSENNKKTLSLKKGKLSLNKDKLGLKGGIAPKPQPGQGNSVVVVKRSRGGAPASGSLTDAERDRRLEAIKRSEEIKKQKEAEAKRIAAEAEERANLKAAEESQSRQELKPEPSEPAAPIAKKKEVPTTDDADAIAAQQVEKEAHHKVKHKALPVKAAEEERPKPKSLDHHARRNKKISVTDLERIGDDDDAFRFRRGSKRDKKKKEIQPIEKVFRVVELPDIITVQELSNRMSEKAATVIKELMRMGTMATINQPLDADTAELVVTELGHTAKRITSESIEAGIIDSKEDEPENMLPRPPVVTIMGHVDHGKTSLLDALRLTDVAAGEAGGITQHIGAYQVKLPSGQRITFLDTPGHEAFTAMRLRGAHVTDIVVLVVAADDGIMEQTVEAINHAKAAGAPIIVAINKIDKPGADPTRVKNELLQHGLVPEDMGGDTMTIEVSAKQKINLDGLEETILLQAEFLELKANPSREAKGSVVESRMEKGRGNVTTMLVQAGTLNAGDIVVAGTCYGKVRALINDKGKKIKEAGPAMPVEVLGMNESPVAGDTFVVVKDEKSARQLCDMRKQQAIAKSVKPKMTLDQLFADSSAGIKHLPIIIKADVQGSVEAISSSLQKLSTEEVKVNVIHSGVGGITESDVTLASASQAIILGFNVRANPQAKELANKNGIDIRYYSVIYNLVDEIRAAMSGMLSPTVKEIFLGIAEVRQVFNLTKFGKVAGSYVTEGLIKRAAHARLLRDDVVIYDGKLKALKRFKEDASEVKQGFECGISFDKYEDLKVGDKIEAYELIEEAREL
jgi:translation initiation factor IF-2